MIRLAFIVTALVLSACSQPPAEPAQPGSDPAVLTVPGLAPYIGVWEIEDGQLRQAFIVREDGEAVSACMTAPNEDGGWRVVSAGEYRADGEEIRGRFTGEDMGFERLDAVGYPVGGDGGVDWVNTVLTADGEMISYETWAAPSGGVFTYVIERGDGVDRQLWFAGKWRYRNDLTAECG